MLVVSCFRQPWCPSIIYHNITSITHNQYTDIYPLLNIYFIFILTLILILVQTVEVNMGALGEYTVFVYSDGFIVHSKKYGNTLEISSVGQPTMFVRDYDETSSVTVLGDIKGSVQFCSVRVPSLSPSPAAGGVDVGGASEKETDNDNGNDNDNNARWESSCTTAAFGPRGTEAPVSGFVDVSTPFEELSRYEATFDFQYVYRDIGDMAISLIFYYHILPS